MFANQGGHEKCPVHCNKILEFFCTNCKKYTCDDCQHVLDCYQNKHNVIPLADAENEFNQNASEVMKIAKEIKGKLDETFYSIFEDTSHFESNLELCRTTIVMKEREMIEFVTKQCLELMLELENLYKKQNEARISKIKDLDAKKAKVNRLETLITSIMNKPEETESLVNYKRSINAIKDNVFETFHKRKITPNFVTSSLNDLIKTEGIGKITTVDDTFNVAKGDQSITVTRGHPVVVKVSSRTESDACKLLAATIRRKSSGEESTATVEYKGSGEYRITGRCNEEGDWQMEITAGELHIKDSPVNVKVEPLGLVRTISNISDHKEHAKTNKVTDVVLDEDGCILVSSGSRDILKFDPKSGEFKKRIQVPQNVKVIRMHRMGKDRLVYSDKTGKCIVMCDNRFQEIRTFGRGEFKLPFGLTVNKITRVMYVADRDAHCVLKFNIDDGKLLGKIGSKGSKAGQMNEPIDVTVTEEGNLIVADLKNNRIQMFDANGKFLKITVGSSDKDSGVKGPCCVTLNGDENVIISSNDKLQVFDKNGVFIRRVDHRGVLNIPAGSCVISTRPRRVAVANHATNSVKIFNY